MTSLLFAFGIGSASVYGLYSGLTGYNKTDKEKIKLLDSIEKYENVLPDNTKKIVYTDVKTASGLVKLYKIKEKTNVTYSRVNEFNYLVVSPETSKTIVFNKLVEPELGLDNYIPTRDPTKYLLDKTTCEYYEGSGNAIVASVLKKYGFNNLTLSNSKKYSAVFYPMENSMVYMYGYKTPEGKFVSEIVGTDNTEVAKCILEKQYLHNFSKIFFSVGGLIFSAGLLAFKN